MTVDSLWAVLLEANCGVAVDACQLRKECKRVAIDLSIWICEALSSFALLQHHKNPSLNLVYQRIVKLLKMGIIPVAVIEGTTSTASKSNATAATKKRTYGGQFRQACHDCQQLLLEMGVIVLSANGEGEALCALLNQKGLVDGIITNDGDIFLYGGISVYTNFSVESLHKGQVLRYHASSLRAVVQDESSNDAVSSDEESVTAVDVMDDGNVTYGLDNYQQVIYFPSNKITSTKETIPLNQDDLIAFAFLTGSDVFGDGVPFVGYKKAVRFIHGTKKRSNTASETATASSGNTNSTTTSSLTSLQVLKMWVEQIKEEGETTAAHSKTQCSKCLHKGDHRSHKRQGCIECGTKGYCIAAAPDERFRQSLKKKVQSFRDRFVFLENLIAHYKTSEGNNTVLAAAANIEIQINQCKNSIQRMVSALLMKNACTNLIVYGRSRATSREYMWQSLSKLSARLHMLKLPDVMADGNVGQEDLDKSIQLLPTKLIQRQTHESIECYKVTWSFKDPVVSSINSATTSFTTMEWKSLVDIQYPALVEEFNVEQRRAEQRRAKESRQVLFHGRPQKTQPFEENKKISKRVFRVALGPSKGCAEINPNQKPDDIVSLTRFASHSPCYSFNRTNNTQFEVKQINKHSKKTQDDSPFIIFKPHYSLDSPLREEHILEFTPQAMKGMLENIPTKKKRKGMLQEMDLSRSCEKSSANCYSRYCIALSSSPKPLRMTPRDPLKETGVQNTFDGDAVWMVCNNNNTRYHLLHEEEGLSTPIKNKTDDPQSETTYEQSCCSIFTTPIKNNIKKEMLLDTDKQHAGLRIPSPSSLCDGHLEPANQRRIQKATPENMLSSRGGFEVELQEASDQSRCEWREPKKEERKISKLGTGAIFWMNMIKMSPIRTSKCS